VDSRNLPGEVRFSDEKMQKVSLFGSDHYFCDLYCLRPGQQQRVHRHQESDKIYYVIEGTGRFHIAGEERSLSAGEMVVAKPLEDHGVQNEQDVDLVLLVFMSPRP
jgi:mannose-6-phosphate isomerase-like protein (cupin superfamily)